MNEKRKKVLVRHVSDPALVAKKLKDNRKAIYLTVKGKLKAELLKKLKS